MRRSRARGTADEDSADELELLALRGKPDHPAPEDCEYYLCGPCAPRWNGWLDGMGEASSGGGLNRGAG